MKIVPISNVLIIALLSCSRSTPDHERNVAKEWMDLYNEEMHQLESMTHDGFLTPAPVQQHGDEISIASDTSGTIDWDHPIGFAVIDCDRKSHMIDGANSVRLSWDTKRHCLVVSP
jgi:hypothetical protein